MNENAASCNLNIGHGHLYFWFDLLVYMKLKVIILHIGATEWHSHTTTVMDNHGISWFGLNEPLLPRLTPLGVQQGPFPWEPGGILES